MDLFPLDETVPGQDQVGAILPPPGAPQSADATLWHPRAWDLHIWIVEDSNSNTPVVEIFSQEPVPGIDADGLFFYHETFQ